MEGKLKILMTTDTVGGVWVYSLELCKALQEFNVQVHLAALGGWPSKTQQEEISALENVTLYKSDFKLEWMQDPWEDVEKSQKWINCIYHTIQPDLVHLNNYAQVGEDWTCPTISVFHSCVQTWWHAVKGTSAPSEWDRYTELVKSSLAASDIVVAPTNAILEEAKNIHKIGSATTVIYNGREPNISEEKNKEEFILCIGRIWDEAKNLGLLSQIAKNLPWPIYIAGSNINPSTGKAIGLENVVFLGNLGQKEVREWMQRASIFISPTKYEPFGLAILEAAKSNCALVLSELETLKEIWSGAASFFNPEDPDEAERKLLQMIRNESLRNDFSERARSRSEKFGSKETGTAYFDLYQKTIRKRRKTKLVSV